jgi:DMSO/TMAO reductase YedYZ heme-binding membrane subunit
VIHYYWLVKSDERKPLAYGFVLAILLAWRLGNWLYNKPQHASMPSAAHEEPVTTETAQQHI